MIRKFLKSISSSKKGSIVIETALCLPILIYLMFFILEMIKIIIVQSAIDTISLELTYDYCAFRNTNNFNSIIEAYHPKFVNRDDIHVSINAQVDLETLVSGEFGKPVNWSPEIIKKNIPEEVSVQCIEKDNKKEVPSGSAFELTLVCNYPFTSKFVTKLFSPGADKDGKFLIWNRAISICN